jgi:hypothetical protein
MSLKVRSASSDTRSGGTVRVRALYDFNYTPTQNDSSAVSFKAGDEWFLVSKASENWWLVRHNKGSRSFYVPVSYVEIVEKVSSPVSPNVVSPPVPKPRSKPQHASLEDSVLKELDSILDLEEPTSPLSEAVNLCTKSPGVSMPVPDYDDDEDCNGDYVNAASIRKTMARANHSSKFADSDTSDYRKDSHDSLDNNYVKSSSGTTPSSTGRAKATCEQPIYSNFDMSSKSVCTLTF